MVASNIDIFSSNASKIHNNKYSYTEFKYVTAKVKGKINCPDHGIFEQRPDNHLNGQGCPKCAILHASNLKSLGYDLFLEKANLIHNGIYEYEEFEYTNNSLKIRIWCKCHGWFVQTIRGHLNGKGCVKCANDKLRDTKDDFINKALLVPEHIGCNYDYSKFIYRTTKLKGIIICSKHGEFEQSPNSHLAGHGCPICNSSKGETFIRYFLDKYNISYINQKSFDDCRNPKTNSKLKYDFYIPGKNLLIEFDGEQHFRSGCHIGKHITTEQEFVELKYRDMIKTNYCNLKHIELLRIGYSEIKNIDKILTDYFYNTSPGV